MKQPFVGSSFRGLRVDGDDNQGQEERLAPTNAGGVLNTCKSNGDEELAPPISGERVSNT